jgi:hypothetical protein
MRCWRTAFELPLRVYLLYSGSLPDNFGQHPLPPPSIELAIKDPLPGAKVEAAVGHRDHRLAAHDLLLEVRVGGPVPSFRTGVLASAVVLVLADRRVRRQRLQPLLVIVVGRAHRR